VPTLQICNNILVNFGRKNFSVSKEKLAALSVRLKLTMIKMNVSRKKTKKNMSWIS